MAQTRKRGDNSFQIIIFLGRDSDGKKKEHTETFYGTLSQARKYGAELELEMKEKIGPKNGIMTVGELLDLWLDDIKNTVYERTYEKYDYHVRKLKPIVGDLFLYTLTPFFLKQTLKEGIDTALADRTKKDLYATLRTALNAAAVWGLIKEDMMKGVKAPKVEHQERQVLNLNELKVFIDTAKEYKHYLVLRILALTGLRIGEALGLKWQDVNFDLKTVHIVRSANTKQRKLKDTKTSNSPRILDMDDETMDELKKLKKSLGTKAQSQDLVFQSEDGRIVKYNAIRKTKERVLIKSGLHHVRLHDLRHGVGSLMLADGRPLTEVASALGQKPGTTAQTYSHALRKGMSIASLLG